MVWTLRKKIFIGYGITLILMVLVLVWAFINLWDLGQASDAILRENYKSILAAENMVYAIERQDSAILLVFAEYEEQAWKQFHENESEFFQWLARAKDNITVEGEETIVKNIETGYSSYLQHVVELKSISIGSLRKRATFYHEAILPSFLSVRDTCIRLREINQQNMFKVSDRARYIAKRAIWSMAIIGIAAVGIGIGFSLLLSNLLTKPVRQMVDATQKIAEGNYDIQISPHSSDELGRLTDEFNSMAKKLKEFHDLNIEQIMAEKRKSEAIIRSIDDGIILVDAEFKVTGMNPMARRILDVPPDSPQNRHFLEVVKSEQLFNYIRQSMESGKPPSIDEKQNVFSVERDETRHHYQFSITPVHGKKGLLIGVVLLLRDVTRLTELDRLKSEFMMTASHELRTPLTSIGMSIDLLLESAVKKLNEKEQQLLSAAHGDVQRLKALVSNLLDLSRIEAGKMEMEFDNVPVSLLFDQAMGVLKPQAEEKGISLSSEVPTGFPRIKADPGKVIWILTNLISNALRYTDRGGHIWIFAEAMGSYAHISVKDDGAGVPYEYQSKIFDKFVQIKGDKVLGGSGLGLAICKEIVRTHGGTIWVDSIPGKGSTFTFTLPIVESSQGISVPKTSNVI
jgi:NtrC-family two-component system sensor histidine kinase KinB